MLVLTRDLGMKVFIPSYCEIQYVKFDLFFVVLRIEAASCLSIESSSCYKKIDTGDFVYIKVMKNDIVLIRNINNEKIIYMIVNTGRKRKFPTQACFRFDCDKSIKIFREEIAYKIIRQKIPGIEPSKLSLSSFSDIELNKQH